MNPAMRWGAVIGVGFFLIVALAAPLISPYDPYKMGIPLRKNRMRSTCLGRMTLGRICSVS